jgi:hypothetical protein
MAILHLRGRGPNAGLESPTLSVRPRLLIGLILAYPVHEPMYTPARGREQGEPQNSGENPGLHPDHARATRV